MHYGTMVPLTLGAAERASAEGIDVEVIDLRTLLPLDIEYVFFVSDHDASCLLVLPYEINVNAVLPTVINTEADRRDAGCRLKAVG